MLLVQICFPQSRLADLPISSFKGHHSRPAMSCGSVAYGRTPQGSGTVVGNFNGSPADGSGPSVSGDGGCRSIAQKDSRWPLTHLDWMPQDDGINARPPRSHNPSRYEVLEYINNYLYAPRVKNRLPVFTEICPDSPSSSSLSPSNEP